MREKGSVAEMMICPQCKRRYVNYGADEWAYKIPLKNKMLHFCSWKCLRAYETMYPTKRDRIDKAIREGLNDIEIKRLLKVSDRQLNERRRELAVI